MLDYVVGLDGSVVGSITDGIDSLAFNFGPRVIQSGGSNLSYFSSYAFDGFPYPTIDSLAITAVPEPSTALLVDFGMISLGVARRRRI